MFYTTAISTAIATAAGAHLFSLPTPAVLPTILPEYLSPVVPMPMHSLPTSLLSSPTLKPLLTPTLPVSEATPLPVPSSLVKYSAEARRDSVRAYVKTHTHSTINDTTLQILPVTTVDCSQASRLISPVRTSLIPATQPPRLELHSFTRDSVNTNNTTEPYESIVSVPESKPSELRFTASIVYDGPIINASIDRMSTTVTMPTVQKYGVVDTPSIGLPVFQTPTTNSKSVSTPTITTSGLSRMHVFMSVKISGSTTAEN